MAAPPETLLQTQRALPVSLIATERSRFLTCRPTDRARAVIDEYPDIDHLPVVVDAGDEERIIGLFDAFRFCRAAEQSVGEIFVPLAEEHLIGSDAAILDFINSGDEHSCKLLVSGSRITGLVTLSDLQALPVRAALFSMITQLEMLLRDLIRQEFPSSDGWLSRLSAGRQEKLANEVQTAREGDAFIETLQYTQFADKADVVRKSPGFTGSRNEFKKAMKAAEKLRNNLAHANRYASTREDAVRLCETVRAISHWLQHFSTGPQAGEAARGEWA